MIFNDEKDYLMRIIKEFVRVLISLMLGKQYVSVELPDENKYEVSGKKVTELMSMVNNGEVNKAENILLSGLDYNNRDELIAATLFYHYVNEKNDDFLLHSKYSREEVLGGLKQLAEKAGYGEVSHILE